MEWISVKDKLPEEGQIVIGSNGYNVGPYRYRNGEEWGFLDLSVHIDLAEYEQVTHWMALPKMPPETDNSIHINISTHEYWQMINNHWHFRGSLFDRIEDVSIDRPCTDKCAPPEEPPKV